MADKVYTLKEPLNHDGTAYQPGDEITLSDKVAERLLDRGVLEGGKDLETVTTHTDGGAFIAPDEGTELATAENSPTEAGDREAELQAILKNQGWRAIAEIAEPLGIQKPKEGWGDAIPLILQKEKELEQP